MPKKKVADEKKIEDELYEEIYAELKLLIDHEKVSSKDFSFWISILTIGIDAIEGIYKLKRKGERRKEILIRVISRILREEIEDEDVEDRAIKIFEAVAPKAIDSIIFISKQLHTRVSKCCF